MKITWVDGDFNAMVGLDRIYINSSVFKLLKKTKVNKRAPLNYEGVD